MIDSAVMSTDQSQSQTTHQNGEGRTVGEIFRDIRNELCGNPNWKLEEILMRQLEKNDQSKYWDLVEKHPEVRGALDDLLHIVCLWYDMRLSTLHKAFAMKCDEGKTRKWITGPTRSLLAANCELLTTHEIRMGVSSWR